MSLISLNSLGMTLGTPLFTNLSMSIEPGDRIAIVAANGRGKSTLLNLLAGRGDPTSGEIIRARALTMGFMEQDVPAPLMTMTLGDAVAEALPPEARDYERWRADLAMDELEIPQSMRDRTLRELSGGWQRIAMLARLAVADPDLMLLDEPTNHLDLAKIFALERWISRLTRSKAVVIVSHDRAFLDRTTRRTLFLREPASMLYDLPCSEAREALAEHDLAQERQFENDMKAAKQLRRQAAKLNNIAVNSGSDLLTVKTKQLKARAERIEMKTEAAYRERAAGTVALSSSAMQARILFQIKPF